jgi:hypothetical protein
MANLPAPQADDLGPGAVLGSAATPVVSPVAFVSLTAPQPTISPDFGPQVPPSSMSFG